MPVIQLITAMAILGTTLLAAAPLPAFEFVPPQNIVSKEHFTLSPLHLIRTRQGLSYLISEDGRYVFQGGLVDVWNGVEVKSMKELNALSDHMDMDKIGIEPQRMFSLPMGTGEKEVFIFVDPNCSICHKLLAEIQDSKLIQTRFHINAVITPALKKSSLPKACTLADMGRKDPAKALAAFISNTVEPTSGPHIKTDGLKYNLLVAKALSIHNFPYIINPQGRIHVGQPENLYLFLSRQ